MTGINIRVERLPFLLCSFVKFFVRTLFSIAIGYHIRGARSGAGIGETPSSSTPHPHKLGFSGLCYKQPLKACGVVSLSGISSTPPYLLRMPWIVRAVISAYSLREYMEYSPI